MLLGTRIAKARTSIALVSVDVDACIVKVLPFLGGKARWHGRYSQSRKDYYLRVPSERKFSLPLRVVYVIEGAISFAKDHAPGVIKVAALKTTYLEQGFSGRLPRAA